MAGFNTNANSHSGHEWTMQEPEMDITDYRSLAGAYGQSTDELLTSEIRTNLEECSVSSCELISIDARNISPSGGGSSSKPVNVQLHLAEPPTMEANHLPQSAATPDRQKHATHRRSSWEESGASDDGIELETWTFPPGGTQSTDQLVPIPAHESAVSNSGPEDEPKPSNINSLSQSEYLLIPNYKPLVLRWHFQILLVVIIAGMFAFLEYEVHDLPPRDFSLLKMDPLGQERMLGVVSATRTASPPEAVVQVVETVSRQRRALTLPTITAAPRVSPGRPDSSRQAITTLAPRREARLSESLYPNTDALVTAYCGWGSVYWGFFEDSYGEVLYETIPVFDTTDPSWCPCTVADGLHWDNLNFEGAVNGPYWRTNDKHCESVMNAISSFNVRKLMEWPYTPGDGDPRELILSTPPSDPTTHPLWILPTTNDLGDILFPLQIRTAWAIESVAWDSSGSYVGDHRDIFGNKVDDGDIGYFLAVFCCDPEPMVPGSQGAMISGACYTPSTSPLLRREPYYVEVNPTMIECPGTTKYPITWWTLPRRRPSSTSDVATTTSAATVSSPSLTSSMEIRTSGVSTGSEIHDRINTTSSWRASTVISSASVLTTDELSHASTAIPDLTVGSDTQHSQSPMSLIVSFLSLDDVSKSPPSFKNMGATTPVDRGHKPVPVSERRLYGP